MPVGLPPPRAIAPARGPLAHAQIPAEVAIKIALELKKQLVDSDSLDFTQALSLYPAGCDTRLGPACQRSGPSFQLSGLRLAGASGSSAVPDHGSTIVWSVPTAPMHAHLTAGQPRSPHTIAPRHFPTRSFFSSKRLWPWLAMMWQTAVPERCRLQSSNAAHADTRRR